MIVIPDGILLATMRARVRRRQATGSLTRQPDSFSEALNRRVIGLAPEAQCRRGHARQLLFLRSAQARRLSL